MPAVRSWFEAGRPRHAWYIGSGIVTSQFASLAGSEMFDILNAYFVGTLSLSRRARGPGGDLRRLCREEVPKGLRIVRRTTYNDVA